MIDQEAGDGMYALLVATDPDDIAIFSMILQRAGLAVTTVRGLEQAMHTWPERPTDIILLALPEKKPQDQINQVRAAAQVPLIIVVDSVEERLHCELLKLGADLVIAAPFSVKLLIAQIGVLMRRITGLPAFSLPNLEVAGLILNPANRTVELSGKPTQRLTHLEFRVLYTLIINRGQVLPTETIVERVYGYTGQGDRDLIRGLISRLRTKVEADPRQPYYILTVPGVGYSFRGDDQ